MSDEPLRDLERRFRTTGSVDDEVRWLQARRRAGDLDEVGLELAAFLDHPAARALAPDVPTWHAFEARWGRLALLSLLPSWGPTLVRTCLKPLLQDVGEPSSSHEIVTLRHTRARRTLERAANRSDGEEEPDVDVFARWDGIPGRSAFTVFVDHVPLERIVDRVRIPAIDHALASTFDPGAHWHREAQELERRLGAERIERRQLHVLAACGHRPAAMVLKQAPNSVADVGGWLRPFFDRKLGVVAVSAALERMTDPPGIEDLKLAHEPLSVEGEVFVMRHYDLPDEHQRERIARALAVPFEPPTGSNVGPAELALLRRFASTRLPPYYPRTPANELTREDVELEPFAAEIGPWHFRRRIARAFVPVALRDNPRLTSERGRGRPRR